MNTNNLILTLLNIIINLLDVLLVILPILLSVAFMTIIERKQLAAHQRRVGPNTTGYYGLLCYLINTADMINYELILSSAILIIIILTGSLNFTTIIENQQAI